MVHTPRPSSKVAQHSSMRRPASLTAFKGGFFQGCSQWPTFKRLIRPSEAPVTHNDEKQPARHHGLTPPAPLTKDEIFNMFNFPVQMLGGKKSTSSSPVPVTHTHTHTHTHTLSDRQREREIGVLRQIQIYTGYIRLVMMEFIVRVMFVSMTCSSQTTVARTWEGLGKNVIGGGREATGLYVCG